MTASPHPFREVQPDGTPVELNIRGGVNFHWLEDQAGYTVVQEGRKFVYAQLDGAGRLAPTTLLVGQAEPGPAGLRPRTLPRGPGTDVSPCSPANGRTRSSRGWRREASS